MTFKKFLTEKPGKIEIKQKRTRDSIDPLKKLIKEDENVISDDTSDGIIHPTLFPSDGRFQDYCSIIKTKNPKLYKKIVELD